MQKRKTILIDLDGVLNEYVGEYNSNHIPKMKEGAFNFIKETSKEYNIKLFTTRNKELASKWVIENNLEQYITDITNKKEIAWLYIDDRCIKFEGNFSLLTEQIKSFKPWYENNYYN